MKREKICGIYKIQNLVNHKLYYGSSYDIEKRFERHRKTLKNNDHHNILLQRSYNKYGEDKFIFEIVQLCEREELLVIEQSYLDNDEIKFNIAPANGGDLLTKNPNREIIIEKMKDTLIERYKNLSKEERAVIYGKKGKENNKWKGGKEVTRKKCLCGEYIGLKAITCAKCRDRSGAKNSFYQKKHSDETLDKIRNTIEKNKDKKWYNNFEPKDLSYTKKYTVIYEDLSEEIFYGAKAIAEKYSVPCYIVRGVAHYNRNLKRGPLKGIRIIKE